MHKKNDDTTDQSIWRIKKVDVISFVFAYAIAFLMFHYDLNKHHSLQNPMPTREAALLATPAALAAVLFVKYKKRRAE